jgi:HSP20 family protein
MELMKLPQINKKSFRNRFNTYWEPLINRDFLIGRDPFKDLKMTRETKRYPLNIKKLEGYYMLEFQLPGYKKEQISIQIKNDFLIVKGHRDEIKELNSNYIIKEHDIDNFNHTFQLESHTDKNNITANFKNGVLAIKLYNNGNGFSKEKRKMISVM